MAPIDDVAEPWQALPPAGSERVQAVDTIVAQSTTGTPVTMRAVELRPEDRFVHAIDLADALEEELERPAPGYGSDAAVRWLRERVPDEEGESR